MTPNKPAKDLGASDGLSETASVGGKQVDTCSVPLCNRSHYGKSLCQMHYMRVRYHGNTDYQGPLRGEKSPSYKHSPKQVVIPKGGLRG